MNFRETIERAEQVDPKFFSKNAEWMRQHKSKALYRFYIFSSRAWKNKRAQKLKEVNRCEHPGCLSAGPCQVHHITYKTLYDESMSDLKVLCVAHHKFSHSRGDDPGLLGVLAKAAKIEREVEEFAL